MSRLTAQFDPFRNLNEIQHEMNRLFERRVPASAEESGVCDWTPPVDIQETQEQFVIRADVPGVDPNKIELHTENGLLIIRGDRESAHEESAERFVRRERAFGTFFRRFNLPDTADVDKIRARCEHGVLEVAIPKQETLHPRKIRVEG